MAKACPTPQPLRMVLGSIVLITVMFLATFVARFIFPPLLPTMGEGQSGFAINPSQAGSLFLAAAIGSLLGSFAAGFVSSRIKHRGSLLFSMFGIALALVGAYFAASVWALRAVFFVIGICVGLHLPSSVATITAMVRKEDWGKALSIQQLGPPLSLVASPLLAVLLLRWFSWNQTLLWVAGLCALLGLAFLVFLRGVGSFPGDPPNRAFAGPVLRTPSFWWMILLFALGMGAQIGVYTMLPLYLTTERHMDADAANTLLGLANIAPVATVFLGGWLTSRIGEKRMIGISLLLTGIVTVLVGILSGVALKVCVVLMAGLAVCFFPPAFAALSRIVQPTHRSLAAGFCPPTAFLIGGGLLPLILGYVGQAASFSLGIIVIGGVIAVGSAGAFLLRLLDTLEEGC
jgi:NNP family nitrate/nitrite transporter-like MFS transporter